MTSPFELDESGGSRALMPINNDLFMPVLSIQQAVERFNAVVEFVRTVMREGTDYGRIPGTEKATLLKPGAEKLCTLFGLSSRFEIIRSIEDWTGEDHNGEPFFYYLYRCRLQRGSLVIAEGDGSCNSWEQKYRYRQAQRRCPACNQPAIIQGKEEYGGGWVCFRKRGGCGAKFGIDDESITGQQAGRVTNENIADQVNTIQKMAQKRSLICSRIAGGQRQRILHAGRRRLLSHRGGDACCRAVTYGTSRAGGLALHTCPEADGAEPAGAARREREGRRGCATFAC